MSGETVELPRVDYDEVELDDDLVMVDGRPFSGIVYSKYPSGQIYFENHYRDGLPEGLCQEWDPDGQLISRRIAIRGRGSSEIWKWHANGKPALYERFVDGRPVETKQWNEKGELER